MKRIFIAIELPDILKKKIGELQKQIKGPYRWLNPEQIHLTLVFIGETPPAMMETIIEKLNGISLGKFFLQLSVLGYFTRKGVAFVLWLGLARETLLLQLEKQIRDNVASLGIQLEERKEYFPHITFGRSQKAAKRQAEQIRMKHGNFFSEAGEGMKFEVDHFALFASELRPEGVLYRQVARFALT